MLQVTQKTGTESITSSLSILRVRKEESGNYTCEPSNLHSASVILHVLNGKYLLCRSSFRVSKILIGKDQNVVHYILILESIFEKYKDIKDLSDF